MEQWESFVQSHCDEGTGAVIHTPLYDLIAENFPIQFIAKLISTAVSSSDHHNITTISAATLIQDVAETSHFLQKVNSGIAVETLELFRRSAIDFMINHALGTELQKCGEVLTAKLLHSSLESNRKWDEFLELTKRGFSLSQPQILYRILQVFNVQPPQLAREFVTLLKPSIRANHSQFVDTLLTLLEAGNDHRPYSVLASVCGFFTATKWTRLMEGAIMSPFFNNVSSSSSRVSAASSLRLCIDHAADFHLSTDMIRKLEDIIQRLNGSTNLSEKHEAVKLNEACTRRLCKVPRNCHILNTIE